MFVLLMSRRPLSDPLPTPGTDDLVYMLDFDIAFYPIQQFHLRSVTTLSRLL
jgi:hypothetical protein